MTEIKSLMNANELVLRLVRMTEQFDLYVDLLEPLMNRVTHLNLYNQGLHDKRLANIEIEYSTTFLQF